MNLQLHYGYIILFEIGKKRSFLEKCITYLTNSTVTHSAMVYRDDTILEVISNGINATSYHPADHGNLYIFSG